MRTMLAVTMALVVAVAALRAQQPSGDPSPRTVEEFRAAVQAVLTETGVPGAGIALVRTGGVEWAGGVGFADRDTQTPVTADTHFRAGSISKTFIAIALVQLYLDGDIDIEAPVSEIAPEIAIDNAWEHTDPVRVIHLLQHTAGFDDMHFNEMYNDRDAPDLALERVLALNPSSRVVRWRPGTRMSYSNPGYGVAGYLIEKVTGEKYEDRIAERIFKPTGMPTSSFRLTTADALLMARGYRDRTGPPVPYSPIYLRPAGNLHTSALELGRFVQLLLNWGETERDLVVDPEYLSNMEHPRTTLASVAGLRNGYGSAIASLNIDGFPMLGHGGGIEGFSSQYAYSTARDAGFVVLLNSTHSPQAMRRIQQLAVRYLKADVEPPAKPRAAVPAETLRSYEGYYQDANPRNQALAFLEWLTAGRTIRAEGDHLVAQPTFGPSTVLVPVSETLFRLEDEPEPSRVFLTTEDGQSILAGASTYAERLPRWRVESVRWAIFVSAAILLTPPLVLGAGLVAGLIRHRPVRAGQWLKAALALCSLGVIMPIAGFYFADDHTIGTRNLWTLMIFAGSILLPVAAVLSFLLSVDAGRHGAHALMRIYAFAVAISALVVSGYLSAWGMIAFTPWNF